MPVSQQLKGRELRFINLWLVIFGCAENDLYQAGQAAATPGNVIGSNNGFGIAVGDSDRNYIQEIKAGSPDSFKELIRAYQGRLFNFIYRKLGDRQTAEDILQETFLKIHCGLQGYQQRPGCGESAWIFKIAYNLCQNELRRRRRFSSFFQRFSLEAEQRSSVEDPANREDLARLTSTLVNRLPESQKTALLLRVNEGLSYQEISQVMETSVSSVESLIFRARRRLKKALDRARGEK